MPLSGVTIDVLAAAPATDTPAEALLAYLSDLNDSTSLAGLDALNVAYLDPAATPNAVKPSQVKPIENDHGGGCVLHCGQYSGGGVRRAVAGDHCGKRAGSAGGHV